jgi:hypothetical protein
MANWQRRATELLADSRKKCGATGEEYIGDELEKGDLPAMIIAGILTFLPALLIVIGILALLYWWAS